MLDDRQATMAQMRRRETLNLQVDGLMIPAEANLSPSLPKESPFFPFVLYYDIHFVPTNPKIKRAPEERARLSDFEGKSQKNICGLKIPKRAPNTSIWPV